LSKNRFHRLSLATFLLLLFLPSGGAAQSEEGQPVVSMRIQGNQAVSTQLIRAQIKLREGRLFTAAEAQKDIHRLFALGYFSDIKVDVSPEGDGVAVTYIVTERKIIREVLILGNRNIREADIRAAISLRRGETYIPKSIQNDITVIRDLYRQKGFSRSSVSAAYREISPTEVEIVFEILEGTKARVRYITIDNNDSLSDKVIRKRMRTKARFLWFGSLYDATVFNNDIKMIKNLYAENGYIDAEVVDAEVDFFNEGESVRIDIVMNEGPQYFVDSIRVEGNIIFEEKELVALTKTKPEDFYNSIQVGMDAHEMQTFYSDQGYILASVKPHTEINREDKKVAVTYRVNERNLMYVSKVDVKGNIKTKDNVIRRELTVLPGERFDGSKIRRSRQKLLNTQYYKEVLIDTAPTDTSNFKDLIFEVEEDKTGTFNFGAGFSSNDSLVGQIQILQNNFDLFNPFAFTGAGQQFNLSLRPGTELSEYQVSITDPYFMGYPFAAGFDVFLVDREFEDYDQEYFGTGVRVGKRVTDFTTVGLAYSIINYDISNVDEDAPESIKAEEGERSKSAVAMSFTNDTRDNFLDPRTGHKYTGEIELAGGPFGADTDFIKIKGEARWYRPLTEKWVLMTRLEAAAAEEYGDSDFVPVFDRFFAGGSSSVRGYDYREVGPRVDGDPVGGKALLEGSLELSYPLIDIIKGFVFFDFGQVWEEVEDFGQHKINTSVGVGVGLRTPVGPIRIDYGYPINPDDDQGSGRVHFTTGITF
jgi:outer membrane protein insertion porin family